jgi:hypothetical protein
MARIKIEDLACRMLDLLDDLKESQTTLDDAAFKRKLEYAKTANSAARIIIDCKKEETERAKIVMQLSMARKWTEDELQYLERHYSNTDGKDIAQCLGRTAGAIAGMSQKLGLKKSQTYKSKVYRNNNMLRLAKKFGGGYIKKYLKWRKEDYTFFVPKEKHILLYKDNIIGFIVNTKHENHFIATKKDENTTIEKQFFNDLDRAKAWLITPNKK